MSKEKKGGGDGGKVNVVDEGERGRDKQSSSLSQVHTPCNGIERVKQSE